MIWIYKKLSIDIYNNWITIHIYERKDKIICQQMLINLLYTFLKIVCKYLFAYKICELIEIICIMKS